MPSPVHTNERAGTRAVLRHYHMSASKARLVLDLMRGKDVVRAQEILASTPREAAGVVSKVLASAIANAVNNDGLVADELYVASAFADEGTTVKRFRPRARGRASRIRKRTCHITIIVARMEEDQLERARATRTTDSASRSRRVAGSRRRADQQSHAHRREVVREEAAAAAEEAAAEEAAAAEALEHGDDGAAATESDATATDATANDAVERGRRVGRRRGRTPTSRRASRTRRPTPRRAPAGSDERTAPEDDATPSEEHDGLMGQKVNPYGFRLGITTDWKSRWFNERNYRDYVVEDWKIRDYLNTQLESAAVSRIEVERTGDRTRVDIHTARPGIVIGRRGAEADRLKKHLEEITGQANRVSLNIQEIKQPELDAALIAQGICDQLVRRVAFRRAMKRAIQTVQKAGALGVRVQCSGRLGGSEMSRKESYREGRVPLHTLRADIDYGFREARTSTGRVGVKVWIYKGDQLPYKVSVDEKISREAAMAVGDAAGAGGTAPSAAPRLVTAGGGRRRVGAAAATQLADEDELGTEDEVRVEEVVIVEDDGATGTDAPETPTCRRWTSWPPPLSPTSSRRACAPTRRSSAAPRTTTTRRRTSARRWTEC